MATGYGERIRSMIPEDQSIGDFAAAIPMSLSGFRNWLTEDAEPKLSVLARLAEMTGCNLHWLITGEGSSGAGKEDDFTKVRRLHVQGSAGYGKTNTEEKEGEPIAFRKNWLRDHVGVAAENLSVIQARGDSMEPTIRDGALVLVNHEIERIENDGIYAISIEGDLYIKRIQKNFCGGLVIKSDNPAYADQTIEAPESLNIKIVGLIKWAANAY